MEGAPRLMKTTAITIDAVRECFQLALNMDAGRAAALTPADRVGRVQGWDSLGHVKLVFELERRFDLEFDDEEVLDLLSVAAIMEALHKKRR